MHKYRKGFSFLEFMMASCLLSLGLLGCLRLLQITDTASQRALWRSLAQNQLLNVSELIRAHQTQELPHWQQQTKQQLPQSVTRIFLAGANAEITWYQPEPVSLSLKTEK
jgi:Tfp pilus assembly protein PilV